MGKPYSDDLRERVVAAIEAGHTRVKVAELYNMALSTVGGFIKRKRETGSVSPQANRVARTVLTTLIAVAVWWSFLTGHIINNIRGFGS